MIRVIAPILAVALFMEQMDSTLIATSLPAIMAVCQQLSVVFGVAVAGGLLEFSTRMRGSALGLADFQIAFLVVGGLGALASVVYWRLPSDAGSNVSGHRAFPVQKE